jgi:hypothetical protein
MLLANITHFCGTRVLNTNPVLARQAFYHLSHTSPVLLSLFVRSALVFFAQGQSQVPASFLHLLSSLDYRHVPHSLTNILIINNII